MGKGGQNAIGAELDVPNLVCTGSEKDTLHLVDKTTYVSLCQEEESFRNLFFENRNCLDNHGNHGNHGNHHGSVLFRYKRLCTWEGRSRENF